MDASRDREARILHHRRLGDSVNAGPTASRARTSREMRRCHKSRARPMSRPHLWRERPLEGQARHQLGGTLALAEAEHCGSARPRVEDDASVLLGLGDHPGRLLARCVQRERALGDGEVLEGGPASDEAHVQTQAPAAAGDGRARERRRARECLPDGRGLPVPLRVEEQPGVVLASVLGHRPLDAPLEVGGHDEQPRAAGPAEG
mmetsp:Transcript_24317/g.75650  ORF Transcript_24317/g.75650 Transcript_24317/m.75650 type:complete len:204 (+) Transcript_24317:179-790(+)